MYGDHHSLARWLDSLRPRFGSERVNELDEGIQTLLTRLARRHAQDMLDIEAARLLPLGAEVVADRQGVCRATAYNRAARGNQKLSNSENPIRQEAA